jgi:hypothetical protein
MLCGNACLFVCPVFKYYLDNIPWPCKLATFCIQLFLISPANIKKGVAEVAGAKIKIALNCTSILKYIYRVFHKE